MLKFKNLKTDKVVMEMNDNGDVVMNGVITMKEVDLDGKEEKDKEARLLDETIGGEDG